MQMPRDQKSHDSPSSSLDSLDLLQLLKDGASSGEISALIELEAFREELTTLHKDVDAYLEKLDQRGVYVEQWRAFAQFSRQVIQNFIRSIYCDDSIEREVALNSAERCLNLAEKQLVGPLGRENRKNESVLGELQYVLKEMSKTPDPRSLGPRALAGALEFIAENKLELSESLG